MLGWIFASSFVVFPSYESKKQRCFELDMIEKIELGLLPIADGLHLWLVSNLSYLNGVGVLKFLALWKIMFHILMFQQNSIKTRKNLHVNIVIAYRENDVLDNV